MYKFGSREICDVVFKAKTSMQLGALTLKAMQPALYIDSATASTLEQATTTVYAQGGKGNTRLITWEGEKTLTFTVTDALLSPVGIAILTGAKLFGENAGGTDTEFVHVHATATATVKTVDGGTSKYIEIYNSYVDPTAPVFVVDYTNDVIGGMLDTNSATLFKAVKDTALVAGSLTSGGTLNSDMTSFKPDFNGTIIVLGDKNTATANEQVFVDYYESHKASSVSEIQLDSEVFGGNFYVEASTLFRTTDGKDLPAEITIPNAKIQSNITISMSSSGDPSTFDFTMDAMPGYTVFDKSKKVMCVIQTVNEVSSSTSGDTAATVMGHSGTDYSYSTTSGQTADESLIDSVSGNATKLEDITKG